MYLSSKILVEDFYLSAMSVESDEKSLLALLLARLCPKLRNFVLTVTIRQHVERSNLASTAPTRAAPVSLVLETISTVHFSIYVQYVCVETQRRSVNFEASRYRLL